MTLINGIGCGFFRVQNSDCLAERHAKHPGITSGDQFWSQTAGATVFGPVRKGTDYFPANKQWMLNFRTDDQTALIAGLTSSGITVETRPEWDSEWGHFARIHDPEGNPIELWQPPAVKT